MMYEMLKELIKPELVVLIPVLYLIGVALKKSAVQDKHIPWLLGVCGIVLSTVYLAATAGVTGWQGGMMLAFSGITQGILAAGASVYVNQVVKQANKAE